MKRVVVFLIVVFCSLSFISANNASVKQPFASPQPWIEAVLSVKKTIDAGLKQGTITAESADLDQAMKKLQLDFPAEMSIAMPYISSGGKKFLSSTDGSFEEAMVNGICKGFPASGWFSQRIKEVKSETDSGKRIAGLLSLLLTAHQIKQLDEQMEWLNLASIMAAVNDMKTAPDFDPEKINPKLEELRDLIRKGFKGIYENNPASIAAAGRAIQLKREILLSNSHLSFDRILVARYEMGATARVGNPSALGTQPNNWSNQLSARRSGFNAEIAEISNLQGDLHYRTIYKPANGSSVPDLKLHWDAQRLMFSKVDDSNKWQVFEIGIKGDDLRKVIHSPEPDLEFVDACYLPNNKVIAVSNIGYQAVPCVNGGDAVGNMVLYNPEDGDLRRLTFDQDANWHPVVMNNGRIMYVRWEYTDLTHYFSRIVMHMNPDGTEQRSLYGSGSVFPTSIMDVQPIPGHPTRFVGIISGHHGVVRSGRLILFDPAMDRKEERGMVQEMPFSKRPIIPIVKDHMVDGVYPQFIKPYPISDKYFLVTAKLSPTGLWGLYLVDVFDNLTLIKEQECEGFIHGIPLRKKPIPPVIPEKVNLAKKDATVFIQDIYEGEGLPGVPKGTVKSLRVFAYEYAYNRSVSDHLAQGIQSGWDIKRLLGEVPVEEDGSAMFTIPANTPISLQPLDSDGKAIQWMRSWLTGMPGEVVSCVGCHEDQNQIPRPVMAMASRKPARKLEIAKGGVRPFTFELEIQPILDRACIACHNGPLTRNYLGGRIDEKVPGNRRYSKSYLDLHPYIHRQGPEAGMKVLYPYEYHVSTSPLVQMLQRGHHGVELTSEEWKTLYTWIDLNAPYHGSFSAEPYNGFDQYSRRIELTNKYANGMGVDWRAEILAYAQYLNSQPKPEPVKPKTVTPKFEKVRLKGFPFSEKTAKSMVPGGNAKRVVEIAPGIKLNFVRIPAGEFIMGSNITPSDYSPEHIVRIDKAFWMSETEITNEQFRILFPGHDSRFHDQQWKDHVNEGYPANLPGQPVIRVSWNEAMEFCKKISEKTGLSISLPTERQWEWACRAGTNTPFWYGGFDTDFSAYENMSDFQMNKMAVTGVDPQPIAANNPWYAYFTWHPKDERFDDGNMLTVAPGLYKPNRWGLYDMHGNVSEWTRCDYLPYPTSETNQTGGGRKVARGGSWIDPPKMATSYYRKAYLPWQKVYNVGFRIIIEE